MTAAIVAAAVCLGWTGLAALLVIRLVPAGEPRHRVAAVAGRVLALAALLAGRLPRWHRYAPRHALAGGGR